MNTDHIRHALGLTNAKKSYRNYFATEPGADTWDDIQELIAEGLMVRGRDRSWLGGLIIFHVTDKGRKLVDGEGGE